jgi:beta-mannanase
MPWHSDPKTFKKAWQHIWEKFEEAGANRYATWVWSPDAPDIGAPTNYRLSENPEWYYPGDDYVDWIGWSAYARASIPHQDRSFIEFCINNGKLHFHRTHGKSEA